MDVSEGHPLQGALDGWESLLEDRTATATEYRERDWTVATPEPGDVTVDLDLPGFDVLLPDDEFREATDLLSAGVDEYRVYLAFTGGVVFALVALEDTANERVVLVPLYYTQGKLDQLESAAAETGGLSTRLRTLDRTYFVVEHARPSLFDPEA